MGSRVHETAAAMVAAGVLSVGSAFAQDSKPVEGVPAALPQPEPAPEKPVAPDGTAPAVENSPGRTLFLQAQEAAKRAQSITYQGKSYGTGGMESMTSKTQGDVRLLRTPSGFSWLARAVGSGSSTNVKNMEFDVGWREASNEWVDHAAKKVFEKFKGQSKGVAYNMPGPLRLDDLTDPVPFKNELVPAAEYQVEPRKDQGGVACDVVLVNKERTHTRWYLGVDDHLPRKRESILDTAVISGTMVLELNDLHVDEANPPRMTADMLRVAVPEGYTEDRVPPPAPPPPPPPVQPEPEKGVAPEKGAEGTATLPAAAAEATPTAPPPPARAPDFELKTSQGETVSLASLRGKVAVLEFGGSWSLPLRESHGEVQALAQRYKDRDVAVYLVNVREKNAATMSEELRKANATFGLLLAGDAVAKAFGIQQYPSYVVIGKDGMIALVEAGYTKERTVQAVGGVVESALAR